MAKQKEIRLINSKEKAIVSESSYDFINLFDWFLDKEGNCTTIVLLDDNGWQAERMENMVLFQDAYMQGFEKGIYRSVAINKKSLKKAFKMLADAGVEGFAV